MGRLMGFCMLMGSILGEDGDWVVDGVMDDELLIRNQTSSSLLKAFSLMAIYPMVPSSYLQPFLQRLHRRPRNSVAIQVVVNINQHPRISPLIESRRTRPITRNLRPTPTNQQIHTLRVILRPIIAPTRMQTHNLMPQHIRPGLQ